MFKGTVSKKMIKYNRWQQRNGSTIHNVTSGKYNKEEKEIFTLQLTYFLRLNKENVKKGNKERIKRHLFYCKIRTLF